MENFDRKVWDIFVKYEDVVSDEDDYNAMANAVRDSLYRDDLIGNYSMDVDGNISMDSDVEILSQDADSLGLSDYHDLEKYLENDFFLKYEEELEKYYDSKTNKNGERHRPKHPTGDSDDLPTWMYKRDPTRRFE